MFFLFSWLDWKTLKTDNFTVIYKPGYEWEARETLKNLEYHRDKVTTLTGNSPKRFPIVIEDIGAIPNGFADPVFKNIHIYTYPPGGGDIGSTQNWYREVGVHEYTHICHLTKTTGLARATTTLFGTIFQPNMFVPGWVAEGITVYSESQSSLYEGRLNDGYFDSYIGARVKKKAIPSIHTATYSPLEFPGGSGIYLYGGEFFNYLSQRYGERKFAELFNTYGSYFWAPFLGPIFPAVGIDMAAKKIYGKSLSYLFSEWATQQEEKYNDWKMEGEQITKNGWLMSYLTKDVGAYCNTPLLYYFCHYPKKTDALQELWFNEIRELNPVNQKEQTIAVLTSPISAPLIIKDKKLYYATYELKRGYGNVTGESFGYISLLHLKDLNNSEDRILFSDNIRAFCVLEDSSILYSKDRTHRFGSELWLYKNGEKEQIWTADYLVGELKANSKYIVVSARKDFENWDVYLLDLDVGGQNFEPLLTPIADTPWMEYNTELQGDTVIFTANYDKIYSIYAYDLLSHKFYQLTQNGYARNGVIFNDTLYFIGLTEDGFNIYKKEAEFTEYAPTSETINTPEFPRQVLPKNGGYFDVLGTLFKPAVHLPFVLPIDTTLKKWWFGGLLVGADATGENTYAIFLANNPSIGTPLRLYFYSMFFSPLSIDLQYQHKNIAQSQFSYPFLRKLSPGLSNISFSLGGKAFDDNFSRKEIALGVLLGFRFPYTKITIKGELPFERGVLGSNIERTAQKVYLNIQNYVRGGEIRFLINGYNDPANPDSIGLKIRGYPQVYAKMGGSLTIEYSHPVIKIRKGLWNPNLFFEDLCWALFTDIVLLKGSEYDASFGMELKIETGILFGFVKFAPKMGIAITRTKKAGVYWGVDL